MFSQLNPATQQRLIQRVLDYTDGSRPDAQNNPYFDQGVADLIRHFLADAIDFVAGDYIDRELTDYPAESECSSKNADGSWREQARWDNEVDYRIESFMQYLIGPDLVFSVRILQNTDYPGVDRALAKEIKPKIQMTSTGQMTGPETATEMWCLAEKEISAARQQGFTDDLSYQLVGSSFDTSNDSGWFALDSARPDPSAPRLF